MFFRKLTLHRFFLITILAAATVGLYWGWRVFWFLTDDAYIIFRYISNSFLGYGYTWNLPPFRPIEGYTSFLWTVTLDVVWRLTGVQPPEAANFISLLFANGTTYLGIAMLLKVELRPELNRMRLLLVFGALVGTLTNRTYLAWTSSGLETAMFNFLFTAWIFIGLFVPSSARAWPFGMALVSVLAAFTRPDGLLLVATTVLLLTPGWYAQFRASQFSPRLLSPLIPWAALLIGIIWRKLYYGEWLPNTYAAKYVSPWPESGWRYWLSFTMEYALWFWLLLVLIFIVISVRQRFAYVRTQGAAAWLTFTAPGSRGFVRAGIIGALLMHFAYYTFSIGGDHFEYRVYSHLIVLIFVSTLWLMNALQFKALSAVIFLCLFVVCGWAIPWTHWALTQPLTAHAQTQFLVAPVAPQFPAVIRPYFQLFDDIQSWLIKHRVCIRHQEHKILALERAGFYPSRERGLLISPDGHPVYVASSVGVISWRFPTVNVIDWLGLNDYVIARNPVDPARSRQIAHDRFPPVGYTQCFQPNLKIVADNKFVIAQRQADADTVIKDCERRIWPPRATYPPPGEDGNTDNFDLAPMAPEVDTYLWSVWTADPSYIYFVPPAQKSVQAFDALRKAFADYDGWGCLVLPPSSFTSATNPPQYMFAFLPYQNRPPLVELQALFPWTKIVTERYLTAPFPYNLGYAAPVEAQVEIAPSYSVTATWSNNVTFLGYDLPDVVYMPGDTLHLTLYYRAQAPLLDTDFSFFAHVLGEMNAPAPSVLGQDDGEPCRGLYPPRFWQTGTTVAAKVMISFPADMPPGEYNLSTGLYNWQTGERFRFIDLGHDKDVLDLATITIHAP
jgi:arabinofuranosyltransferase